jgi:hypothetical protein
VSGRNLRLAPLENAGLANLAATAAHLLGYEKHERWSASLLDATGNA